MCLKQRLGSTGTNIEGLLQEGVQQGVENMIQNQQGLEVKEDPQGLKARKVGQNVRKPNACPMRKKGSMV